MPVTAPIPPPARRVLFVDDDPLVLQGLQRTLRHLRKSWDMHFVTSGQEALEQMDAGSFDVLVTDMRMPGMSGADLLVEAHRRHPQTIRIILSGQADQDQLVRCIRYAHRFLPKPCEPAEIEQLLGSVHSIENSLSLDRLREVVARLTRIPSVPALYLEIVRMLQDTDAGLEEIAALVAKDPGTTAGLLKIVNSAYFGLSHRIADPQDAVRFLGLDMVRTLVLAVGAFDQFKGRAIDGFSLEDLWRHSMSTGSLARAIAQAEGRQARMQDQCFVAGLLHDLGRLILADNLPDDWHRVVRHATEHKCPSHDAERVVLGVTHAEIGGGVMGLWGLPTSLVEAITNHHTPATAAGDGLTITLALHCADVLTHAQTNANGVFAAPELDHGAIKAAGLGNRLAVWKRLADESSRAGG